jgi:hypothetical protein
MKKKKLKLNKTMGYLTTITFYNDAADQFEKHPKETIEMISKAQSGVQRNHGYDYESIGNHTNPVIIQKPRHADDHTLYLHAGNTVVDVYDAKSEWGIDQFIHEMQYHLKRLKALKKEKKDGN